MTKTELKNIAPTLFPSYSGWCVVSCNDDGSDPRIEGFTYSDTKKAAEAKYREAEFQGVNWIVVKANVVACRPKGWSDPAYVSVMDLLPESE